jgi:hypothetical protein
MTRLGVAPWHVEAVLNHRSGVIKGVAATYNKFQYGPEKAAALALWAEHVERCAGHNGGRMIDDPAKDPETERRLAELEAEVAKLRDEMDLLLAERDGLIKGLKKLLEDLAEP